MTAPAEPQEWDEALADPDVVAAITFIGDQLTRDQLTYLGNLGSDFINAVLAVYNGPV